MLVILLFITTCSFSPLQLRDLGTSEAVEDGVLARMDETEQDLICFHMDDSARMMHIADGKCR